MPLLISFPSRPNVAYNPSPASHPWSMLSISLPRKVLFEFDKNTHAAGKNLAYLPHSFLAPFVFLVVFFSLVVPVGSIVKFFCILVLVGAPASCRILPSNTHHNQLMDFGGSLSGGVMQVDFTSVGASFCVSILAPPSLSQLAGVLFVLMASMISGS